MRPSTAWVNGYNPFPRVPTSSVSLNHFMEILCHLVLVKMNPIFFAFFVSFAFFALNIFCLTST